MSGQIELGFMWTGALADHVGSHAEVEIEVPGLASRIRVLLYESTTQFVVTKSDGTKIGADFISLDFRKANQLRVALTISKIISRNIEGDIRFCATVKIEPENAFEFINGHRHVLVLDNNQEKGLTVRVYNITAIFGFILTILLES